MTEPPPCKRRRIERDDAPTFHLPPEMLIEIALHVTTASALLNMFRVSKPWNEGLGQSEEQLWEHFVKRDFPRQRMPFFEISPRDLYFDQLNRLVNFMGGYAYYCYGFYVNAHIGRVSLSSMAEHLSFKVHRESACDPWLCGDEDLNNKVVPSMKTYEECSLREIIQWFLFECAPRTRCDYVFTDEYGTVDIGVSWTSRRSPEFAHSSHGPVDLSDSSESEDD